VDQLALIEVRREASQSTERSVRLDTASISSILAATRRPHLLDAALSRERLPTVFELAHAHAERRRRCIDLGDGTAPRCVGSFALIHCDHFLKISDGLPSYSQHAAYSGLYAPPAIWRCILNLLPHGFLEPSSPCDRRSYGHVWRDVHRSAALDRPFGYTVCSNVRPVIRVAGCTLPYDFYSMYYFFK
jgi:hypothetical protein